MNPKKILESGLPRLLLTAVCACLLTAIPAAAQITTIYSHTFAGGSAIDNSLNGTTTTVGGGTWVSSDWRANGTALVGTGITTNDDGAYLSFAPTTGLIYTLSMTVTQPTGGDATGWLGLGFTQGNTASDTSFTTTTINAAPWLLWRPSTAGSGGASQVVTRLGPALGATGDATNEGAFTGTQTLTLVLNTQALQWTAEWFVGATSVRGPEAFTTNPTTITHVGFARENGQGSTITSFSLTSGVTEVLSLVKANNSDNLDLGSSWVGGVVPTSAAIAKWDSTVTTANTTSLGADLTFGSIVIADPAGPVTIDPGIDPGNTLTLGAGLVDIDLGAATQDLTLNCGLAMDAANVWNVTSGRTLALGGVVSGSVGVTKLGLGTAILSNANSYNGDTTVNGGTLVANNNAALGTGLLALSGGNLSNTASCTLGNDVNLSANAEVNVDASQTLTLNGTVASTGSLTKTGTGMLTLSGTNTYTGATNVSAGTLTLSGNRTATATGGFFVGNQASSTGTLNVTDGNFTVGTTGSNFQVGTATGAVGIMNQSGGTLTTIGNQLLIGAGGTGTYNLSAGQINTIAGALGVVLGVNSDTTGNFNLSGTGILNMAAASTLQIGRSQGVNTPTTNTTGLFNQTGGTATVGILAMGGISTDSADTAGANATLTLTGGTFSAVTFSALSGGDSSVSTINIGGTAVVTLPNFPTGRGTNTTTTLNFDGGTLLNSATGTFITGLTNAFIEDGGAQFDTSLNSTTITQNLLTHGSSLGGGLTKIGANTLTLGGANTYTGATLVSEGTLALVGGSQESAITVEDGATLGFDIALPTSSTQSVTLNAGHKISVSGSPTLSSYTLLTTTATITGAAPNLDPAIPGYDVIVDGGNTLKLVSTATNTFASWISNPAFGLAPADQELGDDPDGDGIDNGVENFFGTNPGVSSSGLVAVSASGGTFTFTHPKNSTPASDLTASYTWSKDLATFLADGATDGALTKVDFTTEANTPSPGITTVTATVTGTATSKLFLRVNVTQP